MGAVKLYKIHDSILMWSYYSKHKGIYIDLDMEKSVLSLSIGVSI